LPTPRFIAVARWLDFHQVAPRDRWPSIDRLRRTLEANPAVRTALAIEERGAAAPNLTAAHVPLAEIISRFGR
jgi:glutathione S-transferase